MEGIDAFKYHMEGYDIVEQRCLNHKPTVIAGNAYPTQIPNIDSQLLNHLTRGLCIEIPTPDFDTKAKIISEELKRNGIDWPIEACRYAAFNTSPEGNQIEGELNKILAIRELL